MNVAYIKAMLKGNNRKNTTKISQGLMIKT